MAQDAANGTTHGDPGRDLTTCPTVIAPPRSTVSSRSRRTGLNRYKTEYIDPIASIMATTAAYRNLRIVAIVEIDSLPNLVTNLNLAGCKQEAKAQRRLRAGCGLRAVQAVRDPETSTTP